jgi:outer membrane protein OmpA-like peptidoglycan-associated protein
MRFNTLLLCILVTLGLQPNLEAQEASTESSSAYGLPKTSDFDRWSAGLHVGASYLFSDLLKGSGGNNNRYLNQGMFLPTYGLSIQYQISHSIGIRGRGMLTRFEGYDDEPLRTFDDNGEPTGPSKKWPVKYSTPINEGTLEFVYNFGNISFLNRNKNFHLTTSLGLGFFGFDTEVRRDSASTAIERSSGKITELMVPFSFGFKYNVSKISIGAALEYRKTFTDNVDATRKVNSETDNYAMFTVGIHYTFGKKNKPMEWVNPMEVVYNDIADLKEKIDIVSGDKDKDGISDLFDKDNNTPEGAKVYGDGTAIDTDGDGIIDLNDADPFTPKGAKVDALGQELDSDGDGVPDSRDLEPNTPPGAVINFQGITLAPPGEYAGAGIFGNEGANNGTEGTGASGTGASGQSVAAGRGSGYLPSVFFDMGSSTVKSIYHDRLLTIARAMRANPGVKLNITGNCDTAGSVEENLRLGQRRAENTRQHLVSQYGIDASRIRTESKGKNEPVAKALNPMNRRVDFTLE